MPSTITPSASPVSATGGLAAAAIKTRRATTDSSPDVCTKGFERLRATPLQEWAKWAISAQPKRDLAHLARYLNGTPWEKKTPSRFSCSRRDLPGVSLPGEHRRGARPSVDLPRRCSTHAVRGPIPPYTKSRRSSKTAPTIPRPYRPLRLQTTSSYGWRWTHRTLRTKKSYLFQKPCPKKWVSPRHRCEDVADNRSEPPHTLATPKPTTAILAPTRNPTESPATPSASSRSKTCRCCQCPGNRTPRRPCWPSL